METFALLGLVAMGGVVAFTQFGDGAKNAIQGEAPSGLTTRPGGMVVSRQAGIEVLKLFDDAKYFVEGAARIVPEEPAKFVDPLANYDHASARNLSVDFRPGDFYDEATIPPDYMLNAAFVNPKIRSDVATVKNEAIVGLEGGQAVPRLINCQKVTVTTDLMFGGRGPCQSLRNYGEVLDRQRETPTMVPDSLDTLALIRPLGGASDFLVAFGGEIGRFQVEQQIHRWGPNAKGVLVLEWHWGNAHIHNFVNVDGMALLVDNQVANDVNWLWQRFDLAARVKLFRTSDVPAAAMDEIRKQRTGQFEIQFVQDQARAAWARIQSEFGPQAAVVAPAITPVVAPQQTITQQIAAFLHKHFPPDAGGVPREIPHDLQGAAAVEAQAHVPADYLINPDFVNPDVASDPPAVLNPAIGQAQTKAEHPRRINCQNVAVATDRMLGGGGPCQALRNRGVNPDGTPDSARAGDLAKRLGGNGQSLAYTGRMVSREAIMDGIREWGDGAKGIISMRRDGKGHVRNFVNLGGVPVLIENQFRAASSLWIAVDNAHEVELHRTPNMTEEMVAHLRQLLAEIPNYVGFAK